jgi:imidazolonepropionase-like amidohydrolase
MVLDVMRAGGHRRRHGYAERDQPARRAADHVTAGMTPYEALKAAAVNPAQALALDAGTIEAGKLADLVIVDGDRWRTS